MNRYGKACGYHSVKKTAQVLKALKRDFAPIVWEDTSWHNALSKALAD